MISHLSRKNLRWIHIGCIIVYKCILSVCHDNWILFNAIEAIRNRYACVIIRRNECNIKLCYKNRMKCNICIRSNNTNIKSSYIARNTSTVPKKKAITRYRTKIKTSDERTTEISLVFFFKNDKKSNII